MMFNKRNIIRVICILWLVLWCNFIVRDLFCRAGLFSEYGQLILKDNDSRYSQVYGDDLYACLKLARSVLSKDSTFSLEGIERYSLAYRRAVYYLYPALESKTPDYIVVYKNPGIKKPGYRKIEAFNKESFILKRI